MSNGRLGLGHSERSVDGRSVTLGLLVAPCRPKLRVHAHGGGDHAGHIICAKRLPKRLHAVTGGYKRL